MSGHGAYEDVVVVVLLRVEIGVSGGRIGSKSGGARLVLFCDFDGTVILEEEKEGLFCLGLNEEGVVDGDIVDVGVNILHFLAGGRSDSGLLVGELCSCNKKLVDHVTSDYPEVVTVDVNGLDFVDSKVGVSLKECASIEATAVDPHSRGEEDEVVT